MGGVRGKRRAMDFLHLSRKKDRECFELQLFVFCTWRCVLIFCGFLVFRLVTPLYPLVNRRILRRLAREGSDENFEVKRCVSTVLVLLGNKLQLSLLIRPYFLYALKRS